VSDGESGKRLIEARADLALVLTNVSRLKEDYQDVLLLRLIDGLSFGDIAKITEKSEGNVRVIFHRALKALDRLT
jgi:RNA polymerase sigma factor (sigma-70 family)